MRVTERATMPRTHSCVMVAPSTSERSGPTTSNASSTCSSA